MSGRTGFVAIPRDLRKRLPNPRDRAAFVELRLDAAWGTFEGRRRKFQPGEVALSLTEAAERWGCSVKQARGTVARLLKAGVMESTGREDGRSSSRTVYRVKFLADLGHAKGHAKGHAETRAQRGPEGQAGHAKGHTRGHGNTEGPEVIRTRRRGPEPPNPPPRASAAQVELAGISAEQPTAPRTQRPLQPATATTNAFGFARLAAQHPKPLSDRTRPRARKAYHALRLSEAGERALLERHRRWCAAGRWERAAGQFAPTLDAFLSSEMVARDPPEAEPKHGDVPGEGLAPSGYCPGCWDAGRKMRGGEYGGLCSDHEHGRHVGAG